MQQVATALAAQMTAAGITPDNVTGHPAYLHSAGLGLLRYAMDENQPVLGQHACSLRQDGRDWLCWDAWGYQAARITYRDGAWRVA